MMHWLDVSNANDLDDALDMAVALRFVDVAIERAPPNRANVLLRWMNGESLAQATATEGYSFPTGRRYADELVSEVRRFCGMPPTDKEAARIAAARVAEREREATEKAKAEEKSKAKAAHVAMSLLRANERRLLKEERRAATAKMRIDERKKREKIKAEKKRIDERKKREKIKAEKKRIDDAMRRDMEAKDKAEKRKRARMSRLERTKLICAEQAKAERKRKREEGRWSFRPRTMTKLSEQDEARLADAVAVVDALLGRTKT
jgi:hypothetical protein